MKMLSPDVAKQAETLAKAKDLKLLARRLPPAFPLVKYLADNKAGKGTYHEAYCPMVKANWLQKGTEIKKSVYGQSMLTAVSSRIKGDKFISRESGASLRREIIHWTDNLDEMLNEVVIPRAVKYGTVSDG